MKPKKRSRLSFLIIISRGENKLAKNILVSIKNEILAFVSCVKSFLNKLICIIRQSKDTFKQPFVYIYLVLFVGTLAFGTFGFKNNSNNFELATSLYLQDTIFKEDYLGFELDSVTIEKGDSSNYSIWRSIGDKINYQSRKSAFALTKPVVGNEPIAFDVTFNGRSVSSIQIGDFYSYRNEAHGSNTFSAIDLYKLDSSYNGQMLTTYDFVGRDAGSYIPYSLANLLAESSETISNLKELLGLRYSITYGDKTFVLSINNIYFDTVEKVSDKTIGSSGQLFSIGVNMPIITDLKAINDCWDSKTYICSKGDMSSSIRMFKAFSKYSFSMNDNVEIKFLNKAGERIKISDESSFIVKNGLYGLSNPNPGHIALSVFAVLFGIAFVAVQIIFSRKRKTMIETAIFDFALMTLYLLISLATRLIISNDLAFFVTNNIFVATFGFVVLVALFAILLIFGRVTKHE